MKQEIHFGKNCWRMFRILKRSQIKKILEFQEILERLITQELHAKKEGEDRWRTLDAAIRRQQMARREAAASSEKKGKKKNGV